MRTSLLTWSLIIACGIPAFAQNEYNLTLEESIEIAKNRSYTMLKLIEDTRIAEHNLNATMRSLRTHIYLNGTLPNYSAQVRQYEDEYGYHYYNVKQLSYSGNLQVNQPFLTNGSIYFNTGANSLADYDKNNRATNFYTTIGFSQPLDAFYGYNATKAAYTRAKLDYERSSKSQKREELNIVYSVSYAYYNLLQLQKSTEIALLDLERQTDAFEISKNKYESGLIREVEALQMEVDLAEAQSSYDMAILSQESATMSFKELLGIGLQDKVNLKSELLYKSIIVDPEKAVNLALANRLELREQDIEIELQNLAIKQQRAEGMIGARINGYLEQAGYSYDPRSMKFGNFMDHTFREYKNSPSNFGISLTLSYTLFDWGENRSRVRAAQARRRRYEFQREELERSIETEVINLSSSINSNLKRLKLLERNVQVAEKSFEITLQRFSDGDIDSQNLALERNRLNTAYRTHLNAYINYQLSLADLMRKTFYDFQNDVMVE